MKRKGASGRGSSSTSRRSGISVRTGHTVRVVLPLASDADDPVIALAGHQSRRDGMVAMVVLIWPLCAPHFPHPTTLAFAKASARRPTATWIGCSLCGMKGLITVSISGEKVGELKQSADELLATNIIWVKTYRRYAGVAKHFAHLLCAWRPFLSELCGAIQSVGM